MGVPGTKYLIECSRTQPSGAVVDVMRTSSVSWPIWVRGNMRRGLQGCTPQTRCWTCPSNRYGLCRGLVYTHGRLHHRRVRSMDACRGRGLLRSTPRVVPMWQPVVHIQHPSPSKCLCHHRHTLKGYITSGCINRAKC